MINTSIQLHILVLIRYDIPSLQGIVCHLKSTSTSQRFHPKSANKLFVCVTIHKILYLQISIWVTTFTVPHPYLILRGLNGIWNVLSWKIWVLDKRLWLFWRSISNFNAVSCLTGFRVTRHFVHVYLKQHDLYIDMSAIGRRDDVNTCVIVDFLRKGWWSNYPIWWREISSTHATTVGPWRRIGWGIFQFESVSALEIIGFETTDKLIVECEQISSIYRTSHITRIWLWVDSKVAGTLEPSPQNLPMMGESSEAPSLISR